MEAVALHDFHATADDELSFKKGSILKVSEVSQTKVETVDLVKLSMVIVGIHFRYEHAKFNQLINTTHSSQTFMLVLIVFPC